jgi:hypothetical protein
VEPRQDAFHFEVLLQALNLGASTWSAGDMFIELPARSEGFSSSGGASLDCVPVSDRRIRLRGSVPPGQHDVSFTFQVPARGNATERFELRLPPRVAELRVLAEAGRTMHLRVAGFPPAQRTRSEQGQPLLVTQHTATGNNAALSSLSIELGGLPTPGPSRYLALLLALAFLVGGPAIATLLPASSRRKRQARRGPAGLSQARKLLLDECVLLHQARGEGRIGESAFTAARQALLDAIGRLELLRSDPVRPRPQRPDGGRP